MNKDHDDIYVKYFWQHRTAVK